MLANPAKYSITCSVNSIRKVYTNFRKDYRAIVQCLEKTKTEMRGSDSKERQNAADAEKLMNSICNVKFVLILSGITDIYEKYGELINVVQKVNSRDQVFSDADKVMIEDTRLITDLKTSAIERREVLSLFRI